MTPSPLRLALDALPFKPLTRPAMPAVDVLDPCMSRAAWLARAREEHRLLFVSLRGLEKYDHEFRHILAGCRLAFVEMDHRLVAAQAHHEQAVGLIRAMRDRIAGEAPVWTQHQVSLRR